MRKHRLLAAFIAAIFMLALMPGITVQADIISKEAKACKVLGILAGADNSGVTAQYLSAAPTRLQAYIIALRLNGLYEEAGEFTFGTNFTDAYKANWARNYLAYAKNMPELGWTGYPDGRFGINDKINAQAFYKVLLETLGYKQSADFAYARTLNFAEAIDLIDDADKTASLKSFTVDDIAKGIYRALHTNVAGTDKTLVGLLTEKGVFAPGKVEETGLNSYIQITPMIDRKYDAAMVPVKDTYSKMRCSIQENDKTNMAYEIKKDSGRVRLTEKSKTAFVNNTRVVMEEALVEGRDGVYYVPASFVQESAGALGYEAEYIKAGNILNLRKSPVIKSAKSDIVLTKGDKKSIKVEKIFAETDVEDITNRCTFAAVSNNGIVQLVGAGTVTGRRLGSAEIVISCQGKEVDRVAVHVVEEVPEYYPEAYYEQVFEASFRLRKSKFTDGFGAVWNQNPGVKAEIAEGDCMDSGSSLKILDYTAGKSGVTVNLTKLLENRGIKGQPSTLRIYAKGISKVSNLYAAANIRTPLMNLKEESSFALDDVWKNIELMKIDIPADAQEFTLDIASGRNEEILVDAFTITLK